MKSATSVLADCVYPWRLLWREDRKQWSLSNGIGIWFFPDLLTADRALEECRNKWPDGGRSKILNTDTNELNS